MRSFRQSAFAACALATLLSLEAASAAQKEGGPGTADKVRLIGVEHAPDPFNPAVAGDLALTVTFECRPTDSGAANGNTGKEFLVRMATTVSGADGIVWNKTTDFPPFSFPSDLAPNKYHSVTYEEEWDGTGPGGVVVADGSYDYAVQGSLIRVDILGNGRIQEHLVMTSSVGHGTVVVDSLPPDPSEVASEIDPSVATDAYSNTSFLYEGDDPIQTGVEEGTIVPERVAVLRGLVTTRDGSPLTGVTVTILGHPEFGQTLSREDGMFDMAVNGGGALVVCYTKDGYLPAQRHLIQQDAVVTQVDLSEEGYQVARGSVVNDADGTRQSTLLVPPGTSAWVLQPDGTQELVGALSVRMTEYSVGAQGPESMPAELPPTSYYTYCLEIGADEAIAKIGGKDLLLSQAIPVYFENYRGFPVGTPAPLAYYNGDAGVWVPENDGVTLSILSVTDGKANLDIDGDGAPDDAASLALLGILDGERVELAALYIPGQELCRISIPHFSTYDCNYGAGTNVSQDDIELGGEAAGAVDDDKDPCDDKECDDPCKKCPSDEDKACSKDNDKTKGMSIVNTRRQTLGESLPIIGTGMSLHYASQRVAGHIGANSIRIPISGDTVHPEVKKIILEVTVAGQRHTKTFSPGSGIVELFEWDGKDAYGRVVQGRSSATVRIGYECRSYYILPSYVAKSFGVPFGTLGDVEAPRGTTFWSTQIVSIGNFSSRGVGLGGWLLDIHHVYDVVERVLYLGTGGKRVASGRTETVMEHVAGFAGQVETPVDQAYTWWNPQWQPSGLAAAPDGSVYVSDKMNARVIRLSPSGAQEIVATELTAPMGLAVAPDGSVLVADYLEHVVKRIASDGNVTIVAGGNGRGYSGDGLPATDAQLSGPSDVVMGVGGDIFVSDSGNNVIRRIAPDGYIYTHAGTGVAGYGGDGEQAVNAKLNAPMGLTIDDKGTVYFADFGNHRVRSISSSGVITTFAGTGVPGHGDDGALAVETSIYAPLDVAIGVDGSIYFTHSAYGVKFPERRGLVRHVRASGHIYTVAGLGAGLSEAEEGASPTGSAIWNKPGLIAMTPDGDLYIAEYFPDRIRKVTTGLPGSDYGSNILVDAENGRAETFVFSPSGRHLATLDAASPEHRPRYEFFYTGTGMLDKVVDGDGNELVIDRDDAGYPVAIVAPFGQTTSLAVDADGYLDSVANPAGEAHTIAYANGGLLTRFEDPLGAASAYEYDPMGRLTRAEDADGVYVEIERVEADTGRTMTIRKPGYVEVVEYDAEGRKLSRTDPAGTTDYAVNVDGYRDAIYDRRGLVVRYARDAENRVVRRVGPFDPQQAEPETAVQYEYDALGNTTKVIDENGIATSYAYEVDRLASVTTAAGTTTYTYDFMGRKIKEQDPAGAYTEWHYDAQGLLTEVSGSAANGGGCTSCGQAAGASGELGQYINDALGRCIEYIDLEDHSTLYQYDAADRRTKVTDARGYETVFAYDAAGRLKSVTDANTHQTRYDYTPAGRMLSVENAEGDKVTYGYDGSGRQETVSDGEGGTRTTVYDAMGRVKEVKDALGRTTGYAYDAEGNMISMTDASGVVTTYEHDAKGNVTLTVADANGLAAEMVSEYDPGGRLVKTIDPLLHETVFGYDDANRLVKVTSHLGNETSYTYDPVGRQTSVTSGGRTRSTTYNNAGWVTQVSDGETVTDYCYDEVGNRVCVTVSGRAPVYYEYDDTNNLIRTEQSDGVETIVTERIVDPVGNVLTSIDGEEKQTAYEYDGANRLTDVTNPEGETTTYSYDGAGRRTGVTFANGSSRSYEYDKAGQLTETSGGPEGKLTYAYDNLGRQTSVTDANGRSRETDYDSLGRVTQVRNEMSQPVTYGYDIAGRRTSLTDANDNTTLYEYDDDNRLVTMTYPEVAGDPANVETYGYDSGGLLTSKLTPNGDTIGYGYDGAGRLGSVSFGARTVGYGRDGAGAVTSVGGAGDVTTVGYAYDDFGRLTSASDSALQKSIAYTSDKRGLRTGLTLDGTTVAYGYDDAGRLAGVAKDLDSPAGYTYDTGGRRTALDLPNGVSTSYNYDGNDRLLSLTTTGPAGTLASFTYTLDDTGNRDAITYADGSQSSYEYDGAYRLTKETRTDAGGGTAYEIAYQYDNVGNRIRMTSTGSAKAYRADHDTSGLWHMDEPVEDGAILALDSSGHENHLLGGSGLESVDGRLGKAVRFDGTGDLSCEDDPALELGGDDFTLEVWVRPESVTGTSILAQKWHAAADFRSWRLSLVSGVPTFDLSTDGTDATVTTVAGTEALVVSEDGVDEWAHIVVARSGGTVRLLVDGTQVASMADPGEVYDGGTDLLVGENLMGALDEMRLSTTDRVAEDTVGKVVVDYVYNERNQLVTETSGASVKTYSYDPNGNALAIVETVMGIEIAREEMAYDELNRMLSHTGPSGTESFTYRGAEWHRYSADGKTFLYDGDNVLADIADTTTTAFYVTPFLDQNLSMTTAAGTYYYSQDGLGSVRTLTDSSGDLKNTYDFLAFGGAHQPGTNVTVEQRYTYTGREKNPESALMYYRYRQYDPRVGRFGARDPIGYRVDPNLYLYVAARSIQSSDPLGLWPSLYELKMKGREAFCWCATNMSRLAEELRQREADLRNRESVARDLAKDRRLCVVELTKIGLFLMLFSEGVFIPPGGQAAGLVDDAALPLIERTVSGAAGDVGGGSTTERIGRGWAILIEQALKEAAQFDRQADKLQSEADQIRNQIERTQEVADFCRQASKALGALDEELFVF